MVLYVEAGVVDMVGGVGERGHGGGPWPMGHLGVGIAVRSWMGWGRWELVVPYVKAGVVDMVGGRDESVAHVHPLRPKQHRVALGGRRSMIS